MISIFFTALIFKSVITIFNKPIENYNLNDSCKEISPIWYLEATYGSKSSDLLLIRFVLVLKIQSRKGPNSKEGMLATMQDWHILIPVLQSYMDKLMYSWFLLIFIFNRTSSDGFSSITSATSGKYFFINESKIFIVCLLLTHVYATWVRIWLWRATVFLPYLWTSWSLGSGFMKKCGSLQVT